MTYRYLIILRHPEMDDSNALSQIYRKLESLAPEGKRGYYSSYPHPRHITIFYCEVETIKEADNVVVVLNDIRQNILTKPEYTIECNIISNVMRL